MAGAEQTVSDARHRLRFRRQFFLAGPAFESPSGWQRRTIAGGLTLAVHPELDCIVRRRGSLELTLLGFLIDPHRPAARNEELVDWLGAAGEDPRGVVDKAERLGGRWILILHEPGSTVVFADPTGMRQIHYTDPEHPRFACGTQPGLIAALLGLEPDPSAQCEFVEPQVRPDYEHWWPGDRSLYRGIRRLLPNHALNVERRTADRFWPHRELQPLAREEAVTRACEILRGQWAGAAARFKLAQSITAGLDSRTVFAAGREVARDVFYYTMIFYALNARSPDIRVPGRLLRRLGLEHHVVRTPKTMSPAFAELYHANVSTAHDCWGPIMEGLQRVYPEERVAVDGSVSEVARCFYYSHDPHPEDVSPELLADLTGMKKTPFILRAFADWLDGALDPARRSRIPLLDLFYWEQRAGSWAAAALTELDIVQETFTPFNQRELLEALLGVDASLRRPPRYELYREMIRGLWPEALSEPINPPPRFPGLRDLASTALRRVGLEGPARRIFRALRRATR